jgi:hypothetical protein
MNNKFEFGYALLAHSEEKGREVLETITQRWVASYE